MKVSVLLENAPASIRGQLALQGHHNSADVENAIISYLGVTRFLPGGSSGSAPMEVDAIHNKGGGKGKKGKGKGKSKKETRKCWICDGVGHLAADCWWKDEDTSKQENTNKGKKKGKGKGKDKKGKQTVSAVEDEFGDAEVMHLEGQIAPVMSSADAEENRGWIMSTVGRRASDATLGSWEPGRKVTESPHLPTDRNVPQQREEIMLDSGACMHVCPPQWMESCGQWMPTSLQETPKLFTADGSQLEVKGHKQFKLWLPSGGFPLTVPMVVCNVSRPILSVMRLAEKGCTVEFNLQGAKLTKSGDNKQATARLHRGQFMLDVQSCDASKLGRGHRASAIDSSSNTSGYGDGYGQGK